MKQPIRKLMTLLMLLMCSVGVWADDVQDDGGLALEHNFGTKATVTFYAFPLESRQDSEEKKVPTASDIDKFTDNNKVTSITEICDYIVAYVVPADGYWTNAALLKASLIANESIVQTQQSLGPVNQGNTVQTRGTGIDGGKKVTLIKLEEGRNDGAGWYYYEFPEEGTQKDYETDSPVYESLLLDGFVLPKFDLSKGTASTDGKTYTFTVDDVWTTTLTIDEGKTEFTYNGSAQGPTKITNTSIVVKNGSEEAVSFATVSDHVTSELGLSANLTEGKAVNVGSYALTLISKELKVTAQSANTRSATTSTVPTTGIFINKGDIEFKISEATFTETEVSAEGYEGVYDGKSHTIKVTAPKSATVKYGTAEGTYNLTEAPDYTNVSTNTVYYQVTMDNYKTLTGSKTVKITAKPLTITAEAKTKTYGEADPTLTYTKEGLLEGDAITGALARAAGEDVGEYAITQGTLSAGDNYSITFTGAKLTINAADFAEGDVTSKAYEGTYDGEAHTITVTAPKSATVEYGTKKDSYDLKEAPSYTDAGEYTVYYKVSMPNINPVTGSQTIKISKKTLTITANAQEKVAGEKDPDLTYTSDGLVEGDAITGALARAEGEGVGEYDITQGTLTAGDNYTIAFTGAKLTIKDIKASFKVVVAESEGGSVSVSKIEAFPGTQINMKIIPVTGYHLETITIKKSHGGEVQHDITFDAKGESWDYFLMPSDDVIITAVFEKDKAAQNIFIYKSYYGEVVANTISANENEPVNLVAHPAYDNCVLDELVVINDKGKQLDLTTSYDSKEGNIYTFMMTGNWVQVYSTFRGTNDVVDGARPFGLDNRFYQLSQKDQSILQTTAETKDVQIAMSLNANIFCQVADDGSLMKKQGEDVGLMIGGLKKGNFFRIDHDGEIVLENPDIVKIINDAFPQPAHILTRGEDTAIIKPGVAYEVVEDGNLELVLKGSAPLVLKSIIVEGPEPTAINRLQADDEAADLYDLSGRKVDPTSLRKGMYIRNGKKIIIK